MLITLTQIVDDHAECRIDFEIVPVILVLLGCVAGILNAVMSFGSFDASVVFNIAKYLVWELDTWE